MKRKILSVNEMKKNQNIFKFQKFVKTSIKIILFLSWRILRRDLKKNNNNRKKGN